MQFDHINPEEKSFNIGQNAQMRRSRLAAEIAKCEVVCANCHWERTHQQLLRKNPSFGPEGYTDPTP